MDSIGAIVAAIIVALMLVGGGVAAQLAYEDTGETYESFNETFDAGNADTAVTLNNSFVEGAFYGDTVEVRLNDSTQVVEGQDYEWRANNGTLKVLEGDLNNTVNNTIEYDYRIPSEEQTQFAETIAFVFNSAIWLPLVLVFLLVMIGASAMGGLS